MSTTFYRIAHQVLPSQAAEKPSEVWDSLSGPDWSTWLAPKSSPQIIPKIWLKVA